MKQLLTLLTDGSVEQQPRTDFNTDVDNFVDTLVLTNEPEELYAIADRLAYFASQIQDRVKDSVIERISSGDTKTIQVVGDKISLRETKQYEYPVDNQRDLYIAEAQSVEEKIEPLKNQLKGINESIKAREKALQVNGQAMELPSKFSLSVAKK